MNPLSSGERRFSTKVHIQFTDENGSKYSINIERPSKESIGKLLEFAQSVSVEDHETTSADNQPIDTNFSRVYGLLETKFKFGSFNSSDVLRAYEQEYGPTSSLSIVSTYLSRLSKRKLVTRQRTGMGWTYRLNSEETSEAITEQRFTAIKQ